MFAVAHDYRLQREDRGFMCAIEVEIGVGIPPPEMEVSRNAACWLQPFVEADTNEALGHSSSVTLSPSPASVSARPLRYEHSMRGIFFCMPLFPHGRG